MFKNNKDPPKSSTEQTSEGRSVKEATPSSLPSNEYNYDKIDVRL